MPSNTSVIYLAHPHEFPVVGEHLAAKTNKDFNPVLKDGEVLARNLVFSLDPCKSLFSLDICVASRTVVCFVVK